MISLAPGLRAKGLPLALVLALSAEPLAAQCNSLSPEELNRLIDGPPAPRAPEVVTRDPGGRATLRAVRLLDPLSIDGRLEERIYQNVPSVSGFLQQEPKEGESETEKTEVWVALPPRPERISR